MRNRGASDEGDGRSGRLGSVTDRLGFPRVELRVLVVEPLDEVRPRLARDLSTSLTIQIRRQSADGRAGGSEDDGEAEEGMW